MSIVDSREEREQAVERFAAASPGELANDLAFWATSASDSAHEYLQLEKRQGKLRELHGEAETWIVLIGDELRKRRDARRRDPMDVPAGAGDDVEAWRG